MKVLTGPYITWIAAGGANAATDEIIIILPFFLLIIEGKNILVIGCGAGDDISSWLSFKTKSVIAIDYMDYDSNFQNSKWEEVASSIT